VIAAVTIAVIVAVTVEREAEPQIVAESVSETVTTIENERDVGHARALLCRQNLQNLRMPKWKLTMI
jgi:hypothetical protein